MKKILALILVCVFVMASTGFAAQNKPLTNLKTGIDNVVVGTVETPDNISSSNTKGQPAFDKCTKATHDDVGRGITKVVGGLWQVATFWYPKEDAAAAAPAAPAKK